MWIIKNKKIFFIISLVAVGLSLFSIFYFGLNLGIDFKGGSVVEIKYTGEKPELSLLREVLNEDPALPVTVQEVGDQGFILKTKSLTEEEQQSLLAKASFDDQYGLTEERSNSIGPTIGQELSRKGLIAVSLVVVLIIAFIALVFYGASTKVASWKYGVIAVVALIHDIIIPTGIFAALGYFKGTEMDALFLTALLTILGLSVNDTIVVFDRVRENLKNKISPRFDEVVGMSLSQTMTRSINTSLTVIFVLLCLLFLGGPTTKDFALVLTIGMAVGTYSSIFLAAPLLVAWQGRK